MRAIEAKTFSGYGGLQQIELAKLQPARAGSIRFRRGGRSLAPSDRGSAVWQSRLWRGDRL